MAEYRKYRLYLTPPGFATHFQAEADSLSVLVADGVYWVRKYGYNFHIVDVLGDGSERLADGTVRAALDQSC